MSDDKYIHHSYNIKHYYMPWHYSKFSIIDGIITEVIESTKTEYNVLKATKQDEGLIYLKFINNSGSESDILNFCNEFGLLEEDAPVSVYFPITGSYSIMRPHSEDEDLPIKLSLREFRSKQKRFRYIVELYSCLHYISPDESLTELDSLLFSYDEFTKKHKKYKPSILSSMSLEKIKSDRYDNQHTLQGITELIMSAVLIEVRKYVNKISVNIIPKVEQRTLTFKGTLLSGMYFKFYLDILTTLVSRKIEKGVEIRAPIRQCRNSEKCSNIFVTYYKYEQLFCCGKCSHAYHVREGRRKEKLESSSHPPENPCKKKASSSYD